MNMIQEETGTPYLYKLSFSKKDIDIAYRAWSGLSQYPDPFI